MFEINNGNFQLEATIDKMGDVELMDLSSDSNFMICKDN